jgi:hypothetical protein
LQAVGLKAAEGPEQIRVLTLAGVDKIAVSQDDVRFEKVVDGEAVTCALDSQYLRRG